MTEETKTPEKLDPETQKIVDAAVEKAVEEVQAKALAAHETALTKAVDKAVADTKLEIDAQNKVEDTPAAVSKAAKELKVAPGDIHASNVYPDGKIVVITTAGEKLVWPTDKGATAEAAAEKRVEEKASAKVYAAAVAKRRKKNKAEADKINKARS